MKLSQISLLTDENIDPFLVAYLRSKDFDVMDVVESNLAGSADDIILEIAYQNNRVVVTHDRDFGSLAIAGGKAYFGIIYLRPGQIDVTDSIQSCSALISSDIEVIAPFIIVVHNGLAGIRIRYRQQGS